ncbi:MAG: transport-associated protein [Gemmatimonadetes bacterium]|nr:transport-associated protein [Gemmatimonadota bacterium]
MSPFRYREEESSTLATVGTVLVGALAGFAIGMIVSQKVGGLDGLKERLRRGRNGDTPITPPYDAAETWDEVEEEDEFDGGDMVVADSVDSALEERVLEAFTNDPILSERAVDIGSIGAGTIELAGWVDSEEESEHAVVIARGVPGVRTVLNRMAIGEEEERFADAASARAAGDPSYAEAHWEGQQVGIGRTRQGSSNDLDRSADPHVGLSEKWTEQADAERNAVDDIDDIKAERRARSKAVPKGDRTGGSPVAPTGVPKADHVKDPLSAPQSGV